MYVCGQCSGHFTAVPLLSPAAGLITCFYSIKTGAGWLGSKAVD